MNSPPSKWFRLRRVPTWRIWLPISLFAVGLSCWFGPNVYGWLAVTERIPNARYVVVEGWAPDYVMAAAKSEFEDTKAGLLLTTGLPLEQGSYLSEYRDFATLATATLTKMGIESGAIVTVPTPAVLRGRTAAMAIALKRALDEMQVPKVDRRLQLVTLGTHARRSRLIYQRELGPEWHVGVVAVPSRDFPAVAWYTYSRGVKAVIDELVSLVIVALGGS